MNRLLQKAVHTVSVDGADYQISTDFRDCIRTVMAIEDNELTQDEKRQLVLENIYGDENNWPSDIAEALIKALWFLNGGKEPDGKERKKLFDWDIDADRIHSAMLARGVNLDEIDMHWWTFVSHIPELPESSFTRVVYLRDRHQKGKLSKEERKECDQIGWDVITFRSDDALDDDEIWKKLKGGG